MSAALPLPAAGSHTVRILPARLWPRPSGLAAPAQARSCVGMVGCMLPPRLGMAMADLSC